MRRRAAIAYAIAVLFSNAALAADALTPTVDTTIAAPVTGGNGAPQAGDAQGNTADDGVQFGAVNITVTNNSDVSGGVGSPGGADADNSGGNLGGQGGYGVFMPLGQNGTSFFNGLGASITGGAGGAGSNGGGGNADGGHGGTAGVGVQIDSNFTVLTNAGAITSGNGGSGGNAAGAGNGGQGGISNYAVVVDGNDVTVINSGTIQAGAPGAGGTGAANGAPGTAPGAMFLGVRTILNNSGTISGGSNLFAHAVSTSANGATIDNSGLIAGAGGAGIAYYGGVTADGTLVNTGTISSTGFNAIDVGAGALSALTNAGSITATSGSGIHVAATAGITALDNTNGVISSNTGNGLAVFGQIDAFTNTGGLVTSGGSIGAGAAFSLQADQIEDFAIVGGTISNTRVADNGGVALFIGASQTGLVSSTAAIVSNGTGVGQGTAILFGASTLFDNAGTITGNVVDFGGNVQVNFNNSGTVDGDISFTTGGASTVSNGGTITGNIAILSNANGIGITNIDGAIVGDMTFNGAGSHSFAFLGANSAVTGNLIGGSGVDTVDLSGGAYDGNILLGDGANGVFVNGVNWTGIMTGGNDADALTLRGGAFNGNADLLAGANTVTVDGTFDTDGAIDATGGTIDLIVAASGVFTLEDAIANVATLNVNAGGRLNVTAGNLVTPGVLTNAGTIAIAPGTALDVATMTPAAGTFIFDLADGNNSGALAVNAGAVDFTGATIFINLTDPNVVVSPVIPFLIAQGTATALGITNGTLLADNSAMFQFFVYRGGAFTHYGYDNGQVVVVAMQALLADIAAHGDDPNAVALGEALDTIGLNGDADIDDLMLSLVLLSTDQQINDVLDSLLPETDGVAYDIASDANDQVLDVASRRLGDLSIAGREYKLASMSPMGPGARAAASRVWGQAFGRAVAQSKHSYNDGYDADSYGFAVGADTALDKATQLGAAFSYAQTNADGNGVNRTDTDVDSYQLTLYGDHLFDAAIYAKGLVAFGWHQNDIARHDVGGIPGNTARGDYDATQISARAEVGRAYAGGGNLTLVPHVGANFATYDPEGYSETGVGGLALTVDGASLSNLRLGAGLLARWEIELAGGELFQPELRLDYARDLTRDRFETTSQFTGAPDLATFRTQGVKPPADILDLGVGALLATAGGVDLRASYDLELKEDFIAHAGYVRASMPF